MTETFTQHKVWIKPEIEKQIRNERWERIQTSTSKVRIMQEGARPSSGSIADVHLRDGKAWIANRNAALIAAAPEMLDALLEIAGWDGFTFLPPHIWTKIGIAIAKAEDDGVARS